MSLPLDADAVARHLAEAAQAGGRELRRQRAEGFSTYTKSDGSPVTSADLAAEAAILAVLRAELPDVPIVSEELPLPAESPGGRFLLVDPLDGTRGFAEGGDDYCVLVALIENGRPLAGAIDVPEQGRTFWGAKTVRVTSGGRAPSADDPAPRPSSAPRGRCAILSRHHVEPLGRDLCTSLGIESFRHESSAIKFLRLIEGEADLYPRFGTVMQWDIAAGDALLRASGGALYDRAGHEMRYGPGPDGWRVADFIAAARPDLCADAIRVVAERFQGTR